MEVLKQLFFLLLVLVPLFFVGVVAAGGGDGEYVGETLLRIDQPKDKVFYWLIEPDRRKLWKTGLQRSTQSARGWQVGTVVREMYEIDGMREERELKVTAYEHGKLVAYETRFGDVDIKVTYRLRAHLTGRRTGLTVDFEFVYEGFWRKLFDPILGSRLETELEEELANLKLAAESALD